MKATTISVLSRAFVVLSSAVKTVNCDAGSPATYSDVIAPFTNRVAFASGRESMGIIAPRLDYLRL